MEYIKTFVLVIANLISVRNEHLLNGRERYKGNQFYKFYEFQHKIISMSMNFFNISLAVNRQK